MSQTIDQSGNFILSHALCRWCGRPSWDAFPEGVVAEHYRCAYCGHSQDQPPVSTDPRPCAVVSRIVDIVPHPNAERLELILIERPYGVLQLVTGKHYRIGDLGVWLKPGAIIPGWLAHDLWLVGKARTTEPFEVREIEIRGVASPGLWCGQWYRNDSSKESRQRADEMEWAGGERVDGWTRWPRWNPDWKVNDAVDQALEVRPA